MSVNNCINRIFMNLFSGKITQKIIHKIGDMMKI